MDHLIGERSVARLRAFLIAEDERKVNWTIVGLLAGVALIVGALLAFLAPVGGVV